MSWGKPGQGVKPPEQGPADKTLPTPDPAQVQLIRSYGPGHFKIGERDWRYLAPGAAVSGVLGAMLSVASSIYVPILMDWSAEKYGLIGIAFALQSWLLVAGFMVVIGAVFGATVVRDRAR